jgi:hypothetical protein
MGQCKTRPYYRFIFMDNLLLEGGPKRAALVVFAQEENLLRQAHAFDETFKSMVRA